MPHPFDLSALSVEELLDLAEEAAAEARRRIGEQADEVAPEQAD